jgi:hypothetical protein
MKLLPRLWISVALALTLLLSNGSRLRAEEPERVVEESTPVVAASATDEQTLKDPLLEQVNEAIDVTTRRYLTATVHTPWQIMHGLLALRENYLIKLGDEKVKAIDWVSNRATYRGEQWFEKTRFGGRAHPYTKAYAFEGHPNQLLAILSMCNLPMDHEIRAGNGTFTIADMIKHTQAEINSREEITWTLWGLSNFLGTDVSWENKYGEAWSIERLVRMQTHQPVNTAACGGTHGLFALSFARNVHVQSGKPLRGVWLEAEQKIKRYIEESKLYQNPDGSFSTSYFKGRNSSRDFQTRLGSSGHTLEFLMLAMPDNRLNEQWVRNGIAALARDLIDHGRDPAECGALYHAMDGLVIYRDRVMPPSETEEATEVAESEPQTEDKATTEEETRLPVVVNENDAADE